MKINILGSCVSRVALLDGDRSMRGTADDDLELGYFFDKQNVVCAMMPAPFLKEEVEQIMPEELYEPGRLRALKQCLNKDTMEFLLNSDAEYLIMDLYDMQNDFIIYKETSFATYAHEFFNTKLFYANRQNVQLANFMNLPKGLWYGYIDLFFEKISSEYDSDHIILNRFRSNTYYLAKDGMIREIPENFKKPFHSNDNYNASLAELENYIISKYNPYVIDLSKYFMCDENEWDNLNGAHFEKEFYRETFDQIKRIINGETDKRYYSEPDFLNNDRRGFNEDIKRSFDVENGLTMMEKLVEDQDILWLNLLDKLSIYAPDDERVMQYLQVVKDEVIG